MLSLMMIDLPQCLQAASPGRLDYKKAWLQVPESRRSAPDNTVRAQQFWFVSACIALFGTETE
jgi:hypothetical protein